MNLNNMDRELRIIVSLGVCFMLLFSAEFTTLNLQKTIISSIQDERPDFQVEGYSVHGITYTVTCLSFWLAPSVISITGPTLGMTLAALGYATYMMALSLEQAWSVYFGAVVVGISGSILWTAEGKYLVTSSTPQHIPRNICIFWMLFMCAMFPGNIYAYFQLEGKEYLDRSTRRTILYVLASLAGLAGILFSRLKETKSAACPNTGPLEALTKTWALFTNINILVLFITFCYTGLQQAFISGIYGPSIGFTLQFGAQSKQLVPLSGIFAGLGNFLGGACQSIWSNRIHKIIYCRSLIILLSFISESTAYVIIFFNLPDNAVFGNTHDHAVIESSSKTLAIMCSFLLGLGDSFLNTQNFSILAVLHPDNSSQTTALYMLSKAMCVAVSFFCSSHLGLHGLLLTLISVALLSTIAFSTIDRKIIKQKSQQTDNNIDLSP